MLEQPSRAASNTQITGKVPKPGLKWKNCTSIYRQSDNTRRTQKPEKYSTVLYLHQWKVRCFWNCGLDNMQLLVTCVFWGQNVMRTSPNGRHHWDPKSTLGWLAGYMTKKDGTRFWIPTERMFVLSRDVLCMSEVVWNSRNINQNEEMCPTRHVAPTE
jgi:hypothetical protein